MGALFIMAERAAGVGDAALAAARTRFADQGSGTVTALSLPGWRLLHAHYAAGGPDTLLVDGEDFVAVAGTMSVDGLLGRPALAALLASDMLPRPDWMRIAGQFVAIVHRRGRCFVLTDYFGAFQLFHDDAMTLFSTSLLAAADAVPRLSFDPQGVYEFAFNVFPLGDDSVFKELRRLGPDRLVELTPAGATCHPLAKPLPEAVTAQPLAERIDAHRRRLIATVRPYVGEFGDNIQAPLSGGLDSRLLLAALRAEGCTPRLYVYGVAGDADVLIARSVAAAEGIAIDVVDKAGYRPIAPDEFAEQVARNFAEGDALVTDGAMFDNGGNAAARHARHSGGGLAASGGCGEVYRDFFYLADRPTTAAGLARSFFARYDPADTTVAFDEHRFLAAIEDKILAALGRPGDRGPLARTSIEQVYPRVRCRAFFGREISTVGRQGPYLMPFLDQRLVADALTLPMALKQAGRFEAALLAATDPALGRHMSAYGHDFSGPPHLRHRLEEWSTRIRPQRLRRRSYVLRRRLGAMSDGHGGLLSPAYLGRVIDLNFPAMRRFFQTRHIADDGLYRRVATLEYLATRLGTKLVDQGDAPADVAPYVARPCSGA